jgi:hypothetical protein
MNNTMQMRRPLKATTIVTPCHILEIMVNGASMIVGLASLVILLAIGCKYP